MDKKLFLGKDLEKWTQNILLQTSFGELLKNDKIKIHASNLYPIRSAELVKKCIKILLENKCHKLVVNKCPDFLSITNEDSLEVNKSFDYQLTDAEKRTNDLTKLTDDNWSSMEKKYEFVTFYNPHGNKVVTKHNWSTISKQFSGYKSAIVTGKGPTLKDITCNDPTVLKACVNQSIVKVEHPDLLILSDIETIIGIPPEKYKGLKYLMIPEVIGNNHWKACGSWHDIKDKLPEEFTGTFIIFNLPRLPNKELSKTYVKNPNLLNLSETASGTNSILSFLCQNLKQWIKHVEFWGVFSPSIKNKDVFGYHDVIKSDKKIIKHRNYVNRADKTFIGQVHTRLVNTANKAKVELNFN